MANVNLKTDFKNGETLFAYQLNNNFKAIEEALKAMNAIVWQDNADKVVTFRGTTEELMNREIIDGQILYDTTTGESYIDYEGKRISTGSGNAIHIGDTEPTNASTQLWIDRDELAAVGSEVVNSLEGNQERMAPSVAAVNKSNTYSTEEVFTGKYWIDGKKVYRKTFEGLWTTDGGFQIIHGLTNYQITYMEGVVINRTTNTTFLLTSLRPAYPHYSFGFYVNSELIQFEVPEDNGKNYQVYVTLEYTKTTNAVEESEE